MKCEDLPAADGSTEVEKWQVHVLGVPEAPQPDRTSLQRLHESACKAAVDFEIAWFKRYSQVDRITMKSVAERVEQLNILTAAEVNKAEEAENAFRAAAQAAEKVLEPALTVIRELDTEYAGRFAVANDELVTVKLAAGDIRDLRNALAKRGAP